MWGAIKKAINSTLGQKRFKPIDILAEEISHKLYYDIIQASKNQTKTHLHPETPGGTIVEKLKYENDFAYDEVVLPNSTVLLEESAFQSSGISRIYIPSNVTEIEKSCFEDCQNLKKVVFARDAKINKIGERAFVNCSSLEIIALPDMQKNENSTIGTTAFYNCSNLKKIYVPWSDDPNLVLNQYIPWGARNATVVYNWNGDFDSLTDNISVN